MGPGESARFCEWAGVGRRAEKGFSRSVGSLAEAEGGGSMKQGEGRILGVVIKDWLQSRRSGPNAAKATLLKVGMHHVWFFLRTHEGEGREGREEGEGERGGCEGDRMVTQTSQTSSSWTSIPLNSLASEE